MCPPIRILAVEDDEVDAEVLQRALQRQAMPISLTVMTNATAALHYLQQQATAPSPALPHLILVDLNLPGMDGLTFVRALRQEPACQSLVVFIISTSNLDADQVAAYQAGVAGYVLKTKAAAFAGWLALYCTLVELPPV